MATKKRSKIAMDKSKRSLQTVALLPKLLKISLVVAIIGVGLSLTNIFLQIYNVKLLRRAETRHHTFINRISNNRVLGGAWGPRKARRRIAGQEEEEADESDQQQCRYRQKTDWIYYDSGSVDTNGKVTVDFAATEGHVISTASCASSAGSLKFLKHSEHGSNKIYHCTCKANAGESNEVQMGYEKLTCTANYWECPIK